MPEANSTITELPYDNGRASALSSAATKEANAQFSTTLDPNLLRKPEYYVYVYSVYDLPLTRDLAPLLKHTVIPPRPEKKKGSYALCRSFMHPFPQAEKNQDGADVVYYSDALRVALNVICPGHVTPNLDEKINQNDVYSEGNNYALLGVFYSMTNPPKPEEIAAAEARRDKTYRKVLVDARAAEASNPASLYGDKRSQGILTPVHHVAADAMGESFSWHKASQAAETCEVCGDNVKPGTAWHVDATGDVCVRDWKRTVESGKKSIDDVPVSKRW
jgi:hypothetical protein